MMESKFATFDDWSLEAPFLRDAEALPDHVPVVTYPVNALVSIKRRQRTPPRDVQGDSLGTYRFAYRSLIESALKIALSRDLSRPSPAASHLRSQPQRTHCRARPSDFNSSCHNTISIWQPVQCGSLKFSRSTRDKILSFDGSTRGSGGSERFPWLDTCSFRARIIRTIKHGDGKTRA